MHNSEVKDFGRHFLRDTYAS